uniref:DUF38 domain-containing protein n=1 Tax=Panagrolaimus sp. ES5 TaxID=591445 RepID=A0AC34G5D1_9BILA
MDNQLNVPTTSVAKQNGRIAWPEASSLKQYFSLPYSIMYYMAMNPSTPEVYNKLIQSCKYFFERNPILVVERIDEKKICAKKECNAIYGNEPCCVGYDITKITCKFWLTDRLLFGRARRKELNYTSLLRPKVFRCEIKKLEIWDNNVLYDDFKCLASFARIVELLRLKLIHCDGKIVMLEKILELIPNIEEFQYHFDDDYSVITNATVKNILQLENLGNLKSFCLYRIPQVFNIVDLSLFIKRHKDTEIFLHFAGNIIEEHKAQLDALIGTIIDSDVSDCLIHYDGQDGEKLKIMESRFYYRDDELDDDNNIFDSD